MLGYFTYLLGGAYTGAITKNSEFGHAFLFWYQIFVWCTFGLGGHTHIEALLYLPVTAIIGIITGDLLMEVLNMPQILGWQAIDGPHYHKTYDPVTQTTKNTSPRDFYWLRVLAVVILLYGTFVLWELVPTKFGAIAATAVWIPVSFIALYFTILRMNIFLEYHVRKDKQNVATFSDLYMLTAGASIYALWLGVYALIVFIPFAVHRAIESTFWEFYLVLIATGAILVLLFLAFLIVYRRFQAAFEDKRMMQHQTVQ